MTRPERELMDGEVNGFVEWLEYVWITNSLVFWAWFEWFRAFVYLVMGYGVGKYVCFRYDVKEIGGMGVNEDKSMEDVD